MPDIKFEYYNPMNQTFNENTYKGKLLYLQKRKIFDKFDKDKLSGDCGIMFEPSEVIEKMSSYKLFQEIIKESN